MADRICAHAQAEADPDDPVVAGWWSVVDGLVDRREGQWYAVPEAQVAHAARGLIGPATASEEPGVRQLASKLERLWEEQGIDGMRAALTAIDVVLDRRQAA